MNQNAILAGALALCLTLSACGSKAPSPEEVEAAIRDGSVTIEDALDKGWITQEWADSYLEERSVPAADKMAVNKVGAFETETLTGETYTGADLPDTAFLVFLDPEDPGAADFYTGLVDAVEDVRAAGADIVVCSKGTWTTSCSRARPSRWWPTTSPCRRRWPRMTRWPRRSPVWACGM